MSRHLHGLALLGVASLFLISLLGLRSGSATAGERLLAAAGSVGASAGVLPNEYNSLAQALDRKEEELNAREGDLAQRERVLSEMLQDQRNSASFSVRYILIGGFLLLALILINFYLDYRARIREDQAVLPAEAA